MSEQVRVLAPIGVGELIDKITILEIKAEHARGAAAANISHELAELQASVAGSWAVVLNELKPQLAEVNRQIWDVEEEIRNKHARGVYDAEFIALAVAVFENNDRRAVLKRQINERLGSEIVEEKIYSNMTSAGRRKVCFFNYMHNGDVFNTKAMVQAIMRAYPEFEYSYVPNCHADVVKDICPYRLAETFPQQDLNWKSPVTAINGEIFVNTWVGAYEKVALLPGEEHGNLPGFLRMWQQVCREFDAVAGTNLPVPTDPLDLIPTTDWSVFNCAKADAFIASHPATTRLLMCNGPVRSRQSTWGDDAMDSVIHLLADRHPDWQFVCTQGFITDRPNIYFTADIFQQSCDLNEIAYLSRSCDLIWGKNSGPFMYCHVGENFFDPQKIFVASSDRPTDSVPYGCDGIGCHYYHSLSGDPVVLAGQLEDVINRSAGQPPTGTMIVLD